MFGYIAAGFDDIDEQESRRYHEVYCGVCHSIKDRYGQLSRMCLTYDLTFFALLFSSLYEPDEQQGSSRCALHPVEAQSFTRNYFTDYAADLTVAFAYHKCLDDWHDDKSVKALGALQLLKEPYHAAEQRIPEQCKAIESALAYMTQLEENPQTQPDEVANCFGELLGELFAFEQDHWAETLEEFGYHLGRFIYLMDAAIDYEDDEKSGSYNPLVPLGFSPLERKMLLMNIMREASHVFERLPLDQDLHLLRSVLYAGVWQQFNVTFEQEITEAQALHTAPEDTFGDAAYAGDASGADALHNTTDEMSSTYV